MNYVRLNLVIACFFLVSCTSKGQLQSGSIVHSWHFTDTASSGIGFAGVMENKVWFIDSLIVFEMKAIYDSTEYLDTGVIRSQKYEFFKYVFCDLKTLKCQDYYTFSEMAEPQCNYVIPDSLTFFWNFFSGKKPVQLKNKLEDLQDTVIKNTLFKRVKRVQDEKVPFFEYVYYLQKETPSTILHFEKYMSDLFPDYYITRVDAYPCEDVNSKMIKEMRVEKMGLTISEENVIRRWEQNAKTTKLPLISYFESYKNCGSDKKQRK